MSKDLMSHLKKEVKSYNEKVELSVDINGEEYPIIIFPFFKPEKVKLCIDNIAEFFFNAIEEKLKIDPKEEDDLIRYFIIKHFTDIKMSSGKKAKTIYNEFKIVRNSSIFKVLIKSFPEESIQKLYDELYEQIELNAKLQSTMTYYKKQIDKLPLANKEVFESLSLKK